MTADLFATPAHPPRVAPDVYARLNKRRRAIEAELHSLSGIDLADIQQDAATVIASLTGGSDSSKDLDEFGWAHLMNYIECKRDSFKPQAQSPAPRGPAHPGALPSGAQRETIKRLAGRLGMTNDDLAKMTDTRWSWRVCDTRWRASHLIDALKCMVAVQFQLLDRAKALNPDALNERETELRAEFLRRTKPEGLKPGAVLWMADLCDRHRVPLARRNAEGERRNEPDALAAAQPPDWLTNAPPRDDSPLRVGEGPRSERGEGLP